VSRMRITPALVAAAAALGFGGPAGGGMSALQTRPPPPTGKRHGKQKGPARGKSCGACNIALNSGIKKRMRAVRQGAKHQPDLAAGRRRQVSQRERGSLRRTGEVVTP